MSAATSSEASGSRVSSLELFFDLVFVFTVTQIAHLARDAHGPADFLRALLVLAAIWWMYAGYAWLTNALGTTVTLHRILMLFAMAGFLLMAVRIPALATQHGIWFGMAFLFVILVHAALFAHAAGRAILAVLPFNLVLATLAIVSGLVRAEWNWIPWSGTGVAILGSTLARRERGFSLDPGHFVERHGLVILIAIGESVVAIGAGAANMTPGPALVAGAVLGLALAATLWWTYFDGDDVRAEEGLASAQGERRARLALLAFYHAHLLMLAGIIVAAAGVQDVIVDIGRAPATKAAWLVAGGIALYLGGSAWFRRLLDIGPIAMRLVAAALALATTIVGRSTTSLWQLAALVALLIVMLVAERRLRA